MNIKRYKQVLENIKEHPESWNQKIWHCGTQHCFAGWAEMFENSEFKPFSEVIALFESYPTDWNKSQFTIQVATKWLDLDFHQADWLFSPNRKIEDFERELKNHHLYDKNGLDHDGFDRDSVNKNDFVGHNLSLE